MAVPRVSVIIVSWNARSVIEKCLPSVVATEYPNLEIIFADNASTDGSAAWIAREYPSVKIVRHPENWLFCRGNNAALPHATGEYVLLLNNDVEVPPGWLHPLVETMQTHDDVGAVQPKLLQYDDRDQFEYAGAAGGFLDRVGYPFTRGRMFDTMETDRGQYDDPCDVFWATGAALLLRRTALNEVGLLDERFKMHMEEIDLCWRLQRHGYRVRVQPKSTVYHIGGASLPQGSPRKAYYNFRNSLLLLYKNLPPSEWRKTIPLRVACDLAALGRTVAAGRMDEATAILRAYRDAAQMHRYYTDTRPAETDSVVLPPYRGLIPLDYFLRNRTTFASLPPHQFLGPDRTAPSPSSSR
ncbi:glycosyl hydrolase [Salinibacter sp. 10B]|uniref:glycosyltransferase family 2 protein n=1 Tax=Salinibacter sp. 10B TaxID=1923971 RepID=UPI000D279E97|nr:glycosyltransferase family 2 protein [Salinibacter sp. 10B]PQJ34193.1 glycosyl hydrolase [Salinibacter sp. 10B]